MCVLASRPWNGRREQGCGVRKCFPAAPVDALERPDMRRDLQSAAGHGWFDADRLTAQGHRSDVFAPSCKPRRERGRRRGHNRRGVHMILPQGIRRASLRARLNGHASIRAAPVEHCQKFRRQTSSCRSVRANVACAENRTGRLRFVGLAEQVTRKHWERRLTTGLMCSRQEP